MLFKSLLLLLGRRRKVGLNLVDPDSRGKIRMSFSLPVALFRYLCEHPMGVVLNADSETLAREVGYPRVLIERLKKDLTIVKIVLAYQGVAAGEEKAFRAWQLERVPLWLAAIRKAEFVGGRVTNSVLARPHSVIQRTRSCWTSD